MTRVAALLVCWSCLATGLHGADFPAEVLDLSAWKLALPVDTSRPGSPDEIRQPELATFRDVKWFYVDSTNPPDPSVVFRAHCGGATTKGSTYPRCELREMNGPSATKPAKWSTSDSVVHTMIANLAVCHTPDAKRQVVCAQIHDREDDLLMIRLDGKKLIIERNDVGDVPLDVNYELGRFFDLKIQAATGQVRVWYNGQLKLDWEVARDGCYFKAGCYTQSNVKRGDQPDAYGEVAIRRLVVTHEPSR